MIKIRPTGAYLELDDGGHVTRIASLEKTQDAWRPLIEDVKEFYVHELGDNLHSVFLRGSVAKGQAEDGVADLDSFCVVRERARFDEARRREFRAKMKERYPFCLGIELADERD